mmetsp:Transcript_16718/g.33592  ORF Transcript_16718/g.33592 Transcript_16718/m.33592 type:complete len:90 (-) Transcript_16718:1360-1629(-)
MVKPSIQTTSTTSAPPHSPTHTKWPKELLQLRFHPTSWKEQMTFGEDSTPQKTSADPTKAPIHPPTTLNNSDETFALQMAQPVSKLSPY